MRHLDGNKDNNAPDNVVWGNAKENAADRDRHGRTVRGARSSLSKLSERDVQDIRARIARGETQTAIAARYRVCIATVNHIHTGRNWGHL